MLRSALLPPLGSPGLRIHISQRFSLYSQRFAPRKNRDMASMIETPSVRRTTKERAQELKESLGEVKERVSQAVRKSYPTPGP